MLNLKKIFHQQTMQREVLVTGQVVPESSRCVQCGICSYSCPIGIDVRLHAWRGQPVRSSACLTCGECVTRCPRGVLQFEHTNLYENDLLELRRRG